MAHELTGESVHELLDGLVLSSSHVEDFLRELALAAAADFSLPGQEISCSVTLVRCRKAATAASA